MTEKTAIPRVEWEVGQKVMAVTRITEGGLGGRLDAKFPNSDYIHAEEGDLGVVEGVDDGCPTVRFEPKGTATIVGDNEVKVIDLEHLREEPDFVPIRIVPGLAMVNTEAVKKLELYREDDEEGNHA